MIKKKEILHKFINFVCVRVAWVTKGAQFIEWRKHSLLWSPILRPLLFIGCINHLPYFFPSIRIHTDDTSPSAKDQHVLEFQIAMI